MASNRFAPLAAAALLALSFAHVQAQTLGDYFKGSNAPKLVAPSAEETPAWLKDSKRLTELLGSDPTVRIEKPRVVQRVPKVFAGLDAFVVEAMEFSNDHPDGKSQLYFFYSDAAQEYLFVGMAIDMKRGRDVSMDLERYLRGSMAESPSKALRPQEMHSIELKGGKTSATPLTFVTDLGNQAGRESFLNVVTLHRSMMSAGENPRPINFVLVTNAKNELSGAAMAIAYGSHAIKRDGVERLVEYARDGERTSWLQPRKLGNDASIKQMLGTGIFKLDNNSTQALLARLDTLPLLYTGSGAKMANAPMPLGQPEWRKLLAGK